MIPPPGRTNLKVSVVIPVYNGAATIGPLVEGLVLILGAGPLQIVLVNDDSPDHSHEVCRGLTQRYPDNVLYLKLARNFGEHNAVMAGLRYARGDYVVIIDDDFQNPPEEVARVIQHAASGGYDVVYTRYSRKQHHWLRNLGSRFNDQVANFLLNKPRDLYLSSFKCLSRFVVEQVIQYTGPYPYLDGLVLRCTRNIGTTEVRHEPRREGHSNYTLRRLIRLWLNMFTNFSVTPLRVSTLMGLFLSGAGLLLVVIVVAEKLFRPETQMGWASTIIAIVLFSGVQLVMLGLLGEYLGRLFLSVNQTPQFVVREVCEGKAARAGPPPEPPVTVSGDRLHDPLWEEARQPIKGV